MNKINAIFVLNDSITWSESRIISNSILHWILLVFFNVKNRRKKKILSIFPSSDLLWGVTVKISIICKSTIFISNTSVSIGFNWNHIHEADAIVMTSFWWHPINISLDVIWQALGILLQYHDIITIHTGITQRVV